LLGAFNDGQPAEYAARQVQQIPVANSSDSFLLQTAAAFGATASQLITAYIPNLGVATRALNCPARGATPRLVGCSAEDGYAAKGLTGNVNNSAVS
jgi:hypothetical protein